MERITPIYEAFARKTYEAHPEYDWKWVDRIVPINLDRAASILNSDSTVVYNAGHQSKLDYFTPTVVMLKYGFPYGRSIVGSNLNNSIVKRIIGRFGPWGAIWHDREAKDDSELMGVFRKKILGTLRKRNSIFLFPEGTRNENPENGLLPIQERFNLLLVKAQRESDRDIYLECMDFDYDNTPERGLWHKIRARGRFAKIKYHFWDLYSYAHWQLLESQKGEARVNFSTPIKIRDLMGKRARDSVKNIADYTRNTITELREELRVHRESGLRH